MPMPMPMPMPTAGTGWGIACLKRVQCGGVPMAGLTWCTRCVGAGRESKREGLSSYVYVHREKAPLAT